MNKNMLILGGYSKNNISWIENMELEYKLNYNVNIIKYDNWYNDSEMDFNHEINKIYNTIKDKNIDIIIAKSIGIYLTTKLIDKYNIKPKLIIFLGYPLNVLKEENLDIKDDIINLSKTNKVFIIQQDKDPLCYIENLREEFDNKIPIIKINGNDHSYNNYDDLKIIIDNILNKNIETIIYNKNE